ncbi:MAG: hypothetical protein HN704_09105 [Bacteroidetes bacterium]|jgi:hypothetical protein|nr:hypothetical protein [Bacteroidota bacterium]MBT7141957.1 hypothetical protein [Bacteroidota bacterium]MBT7491750.1 hypothetical protein [Bacteroidota bacterium]
MKIAYKNIRAQLVQFFIIGIVISSCTNKSIDQRSVTIGKNEIGIVLTNGKKSVLESGSFKVDSFETLIILNKVDSLSIDEFEFIDFKANPLLCEAKIVFSLKAEHVKNITNDLDWVEDIKSYKKKLLYLRVRDEIRITAGNFETKDLIQENFQKNSSLEDLIQKRLEKYVDIKSLNLRIYEKQ